MDAAWNFRRAYEEARKLKDAQDDFCLRVRVGERGRARRWRWRWSWWRKEGGQGEREEEFPEDLQWESLVDVLRGRVKVCRCRSCFFYALRLIINFRFIGGSFLFIVMR